MPRVAVIFHHIGPYHAARLEAAGRMLDVVGVEWSGRESHPWGQDTSIATYEKVSLFERASHRLYRPATLKAALTNALERAQPDVVAVNGWGDFGSLIAISCCVMLQIPTIIMSESHAIDAPRVRLKEFVKGRVVRLGVAGFVGGRSHGEYLATLGMPHTRIFTGYDVVDNDYFAGGAVVARNSRAEVRKSLCLPEQYFLASSRFIQKKNIPSLLSSYAAYRRNTKASPWSLVLLGDGPLRPEIEARIRCLGLGDAVFLPGFRQYGDLPAYYGLAEAFVHASSIEQWGLVVNEAMASGLPVVVSNRCGCVSELVAEGENGFQFDPADGARLTQIMLELTGDDERRKAMGEASRRRIREWGPDRFARGLRLAVECALSVGPPCPRWGDRVLLKLLSRS